MGKTHRGERIGEEIRRIISELLLRDLAGPEFEGLITISYVRASDDGAFATVYFTTLGGDEKLVQEGFERVKGYIRSQIGGQLGLRYTPQLRFEPDVAEKYGQHIDELLAGANIKQKGEVSLAEIASVLRGNSTVLLFPHIHMDADTLGACAALALSLRALGKDAYVVIGEEVPRSLTFLDFGTFLAAEEAEKLVNNTDYLAALIDFSDLGRMQGELSKRLFEGAKASLCIDHHATSSPETEIYYVDAEAAATSEIVYALLRENDFEISKDAATALYSGIVTDTGRFQYANTTALTHKIAAELFEKGADFRGAFNKLYQNIRFEKLLALKEAIASVEFFADGKVALASITQETLNKLGAGDDETDGISEKLRDISGVVVAIFMRELEDGNIKVSMRSGGQIDVAQVSAQFGGGGHMRAAGFTVGTSMAETKAKLAEALLPLFAA